MAAVHQIGIQRLEVSEHRDRHKEVPTRIADKPFDFALVVALAGAAKPVLEQVVRLQFAEHPRPLALAIAENTGNCDLRVVI